MRLRLKYLLGKGIIVFGIITLFIYIKEGLDDTFPFLILLILLIIGYSIISIFMNKKNTNKNSIKITK